MDGVRVKLLLVVLAGKLLLASAQAWKSIDENKLRSFYEMGEWMDPKHMSLPDDLGYYFEDGDFSDAEDDFPEVEGIASVSFDSLAQNLLLTTKEDSDGSDRRGKVEGGSSRTHQAGSPGRWSGRSSQTRDLDVVCSSDGFEITFLKCPLSDVNVLGTNELLAATDAAPSCGYEVNPVKNTLNVPFTACHVQHLATCNGSTYSLQFLYKIDQLKIATAVCDEERQPSPRTGGSPGRCLPQSPTVAPTTTPTTTAQTTVFPSLPNLNECTPDRHFVFTIEKSSTTIPVDPTKLVIPDHPECQPIFVNESVAVYKFPVTKCGSRTYELGDTKVFLAQVQTVVEVLNLKYGIITRSHPLRFLVECRYSKSGSVSQSVTTVEFTVTMDSSPLPSTVFSDGIYAVELRIATDETYTSYLPTNSLPLHQLLGTKLHLELNLMSLYPDAVVIVKYCIAFPRSATNALVMVHEGCTNPNDPYVYAVVSANRHQRRIAIGTFQFMEQKTNMYLQEDIIFMCSTEVCIESEKQCEDGCFAIQSK